MKNTKIIPLFKFNKRDYILFLVYYLILILFIFIKAIKLLIINKIIYLNNKYSFLLKNDFQKLKYKNIIKVFIIL